MEAANPNRMTVTVGWLLFWLCAGGIGYAVMDRRHQEQTEEIALAPISRGDELMNHEQILRVRARDAGERRRHEFEEALGGAAGAAFKNPDYSLREALQRAAIECAPTNASAQVSVDRFTEFSVTISRSENFSTNEMTEVARRFLPLAKDYLDSLRFSVKGTVVAELDRQDIEFVDDWARVSPQRFAMLVAREVETANQSSGAVDRWKQQRQLSEALSAQAGIEEKLPAAEKGFQAALKNAYEDLNAAITLMQQATALSEITKVSQVEIRLRQLDDATERAGKAKFFFADVSKAWREALAAEGIVGDGQEALVKGFPALFRQDPVKAAKAFEALTATLESSRFFLKMARDQLGDWSFSPESGQFGFTSQEVGRRFQRAREQLIQDEQALEKALRAWNEGVMQ